jgi:hypothetical protein
VSPLRGRAEVRDIARHIRRMALLVRRTVSGTSSGPRSPAASRSCSGGGCPGGGCADAGCGPRHEAPAGGRGWWVLAQGGPLDESDFAAREAAREALLARVRRAGILVAENVWVWDLSGRAQLVLTTLPTLERARKLAQRLRAKGLAIVVRREMPEGLNP